MQAENRSNETRKEEERLAAEITQLQNQLE